MSPTDQQKRQKGNQKENREEAVTTGKVTIPTKEEQTEMKLYPFQMAQLKVPKKHTRCGTGNTLTVTSTGLTSFKIQIRWDERSTQTSEGNQSNTCTFSDRIPGPERLSKAI